ncbi:trehalose-phosphatase [soil metagenome]
MTSEALEVAIRRCVDVLSMEPAGLFTDFDGTISPIALTPDLGQLHPRVRRPLTALVDQLEIVAIVTGRGAEDARQRVDVPGVRLIGNHGLEVVDGDVVRANPFAVAQSNVIAAAVSEIRSEMSSYSWADLLIFENKGVSASIHYRRVPDPESVRERLLTLGTPVVSKSGLRLTEGRLVIELRPAIDVNKGSVVHDVILEGQLKGAVMLGDDVTDVDAFRAIAALRNDGLTGISVGINGPETAVEVREAADFLINGVEECADLLEVVARELSA